MLVIETHGDPEKTEGTAQLISALSEIGKLPHFCDEVEWRGLAWHAICGCEDDLLAFEKKNRWCGSTEGWYTVVGLLAAPEGAPNVPNVPQYVDWGKVKAWLEYKGVFITVEPGYGVHVWDGETFEETFEPEVFVRAAFADDSGMVMNRAFRLSPEDEAWLSGQKGVDDAGQQQVSGAQDGA